MNTILRTEHLCKYYGSGENEVRAVEDNNISIEQGEFVAIVGKSGSGKSTLLHMLGGLDYPTSGKVYVGEKDIFALKEDALWQCSAEERWALFFRYLTWFLPLMCGKILCSPLG